MKGWEGGEGAHALLRISPLSPSHLAVIITQQPRARRERERVEIAFAQCEVVPTHSLRQAGSGEGRERQYAGTQSICHFVVLSDEN